MIKDVFVQNINITIHEFNSVLKHYLKNLNDLDARYGLFDIDSNEKILINTALAGDLLISYIYRQLQYGFPQCWESSYVEGKCMRSKNAKLDFAYIIVSTLDDLLDPWRIVPKRHLLRSVLSNILGNKDNLSLAESIRIFLSWFLEGYSNGEIKEILEKLDSLDDDYVEKVARRLIVRLDKRDKWVDEIIWAKLRVRKLDKYVEEAIKRRDFSNLVELGLIGLAFDGFTWLKSLIFELAALYVYIYNERRVLPFGPMQHVIEGGYTQSISLGDFIDPETNSLVDIKSSVYAVDTRSLVRMSVELRMPIHVAVPHYTRKPDGKIDASKIYLSIYRLRYRKRPELEKIETLWAEVPEKLLKIKSRIKSLFIY